MLGKQSVSRHRRTRLESSFAETVARALDVRASPHAGARCSSPSIAASAAYARGQSHAAFGGRERAAGARRRLICRAGPRLRASSIEERRAADRFGASLVKAGLLLRPSIHAVPVERTALQDFPCGQLAGCQTFHPERARVLRARRTSLPAAGESDRLTHSLLFGRPTREDRLFPRLVARQIGSGVRTP